MGLASTLSSWVFWDAWLAVTWTLVALLLTMYAGGAQLRGMQTVWHWCASLFFIAALCFSAWRFLLAWAQPRNQRNYTPLAYGTAGYMLAYLLTNAQEQHADWRLPPALYAIIPGCAVAVVLGFSSFAAWPLLQAFNAQCKCCRGCRQRRSNTTAQIPAALLTARPQEK